MAWLIFILMAFLSAYPFGHVWIVSTQKEDLTAEEMQRRFDAMMKTPC